MTSLTGPLDRVLDDELPRYAEALNREIAELTSDDELLRIAELPDVPVSLEHLRHVDPQTPHAGRPSA